MSKTGVSIIVSIPHCLLLFFSYLLDNILTAHILSIAQCGILTMIDTPILAIYEKKVFDNVETIVYSRALSV